MSDVSGGILKAEPFAVTVTEGQYWCKLREDQPLLMGQVFLPTPNGVIVLCNAERCMNTGQVRYVPVEISDLPPVVDSE